MTPDPWPELHTHLETGTLPARRWIECVACIDIETLNDGDRDGDAEEWAMAHAKLYPAHTRFRAVSQVRFRLAPRADPAGSNTMSDESERATACGAETSLPDGIAKPELSVLGVDLSDVVVRCVRETHPVDDDHEGPIPGQEGAKFVWSSNYSCGESRTP
ncbi:hypothetical protein ACIBO9_35750 [Streptomyces prunicolor]|uniref:DUF7848 domain-containing protein n=1 Tax=Streptomyces prunicolor TaxID=67348 RepID=UPI0037D7DE1E